MALTNLLVLTALPATLAHIKSMFGTTMMITSGEILQLHAGGVAHKTMMIGSKIIHNGMHEVAVLALQAVLLAIAAVNAETVPTISSW